MKSTKVDILYTVSEALYQAHKNKPSYCCSPVGIYNILSKILWDRKLWITNAPESDEIDDTAATIPESVHATEYRSLITSAHNTALRVEQNALMDGHTELAWIANQVAAACIDGIGELDDLDDDMAEDLQ